jgi:hypothetical protein
MSKERNTAPPQIDPAATARAQSAANRETATTQAQLNMMNQYTPQGSLEYSQSGTWSDGTPKYAATQTLTPNQQQIADYGEQGAMGYGEAGNALLTNIKGMLSQPVDMAQFGAAPTYDENFRNTQRQNMIQRAQPDWDRQRSALDTSLANQGIVDPNSAAYQAKLQNFQRGYNDFLLGADLNAGNAAAGEYGRMQTARQNQINEAYLPRNQELNTLSALLSGSQVSSPQFVSTPQTQVAGVDTSAALGMNQQNALMQQQLANSQSNAMIGGGAGLGGAALMSRFWK